MSIQFGIKQLAVDLRIVEDGIADGGTELPFEDAGH